MANSDNLIPQNERTKEEQRAIATKGGIASGKARREKREMRDFAKIVLDELVKDKKTGAQLPTRYALVKRLVQKALKDGDCNTFKTITQVAGEMPTDNGGGNVVVVNIQSTDKGAKAMERLNELGDE